MCSATIKLEQNTLAVRAKELEIIVDQEQESEGVMQEEVKRFAQLEISDDEILRDLLHRFF